MQVMRFCQPTSVPAPIPVTEHSLVSHFAYITSLHGAAREAYVPVCASGANTLSIHYTANALPLVDGTTVLIDAGCEYGGYASDITRCFPVNGTFTSPQRDLYEAVLRVEKACIEMCTTERGYSLDDLHRKSIELTRVELRDLGFSLRAGDLERTLYPHYLSHPLGVDLHDTPTFKRNEKLQEGMVIVSLPAPLPLTPPRHRTRANDRLHHLLTDDRARIVRAGLRPLPETLQGDGDAG